MDTLHPPPTPTQLVLLWMKFPSQKMGRRKIGWRGVVRGKDEEERKRVGRAGLRRWGGAESS